MLAVIFVVSEASLKGMLLWFEFLSHMPGLSGLVIMALCFGGFVAVMFMVHWVYAGFAGEVKDVDGGDLGDEGDEEVTS